MNSEWMGRYRELVASLVAHSNLVARTILVKVEIGEGISLNATEWQTLEYIIEHRFETLSMIDMSERLGIPQSSFSKTVKTLCGLGLVEKYQAINNRKNIILKPSDAALSLYDDYSRVLDKQFGPFFRELESVSDADLAAVSRAIRALNESLFPPEPAETQGAPKLIRKG